ncbi:hypothetical protein BDV96DRAFT_601182 [Lophiotrema nucula]|uniref:Uncharacterized protein n=1 Tax=Lophiotrema nucula TaxID=690887 RepID=A0A6A5Z3Q6_9PLEO|nr:hypothetical protein BDV96DRAFT_601182 [Lophiotrema nucula]
MRVFCFTLELPPGNVTVWPTPQALAQQSCQAVQYTPLEITIELRLSGLPESVAIVLKGNESTSLNLPSPHTSKRSSDTLSIPNEPSILPLTNSMPCPADANSSAFTAPTNYVTPNRSASGMPTNYANWTTNATNRFGSGLGFPRPTSGDFILSNAGVRHERIGMQALIFFVFAQTALAAWL